MKHVSLIHAGWLLGALSVSVVMGTGCLKDLGLSSGASITEEGSSGFGTSGGGAVGMTGATGFGAGGGPIAMTSATGFGVGGATAGMTTGTGMMGGVGGSVGMTTGTGTSMVGGVGGSAGVTTGSGMTTGTGMTMGSSVSTGTGMTMGSSVSTSSGTSGGPAPSCSLGSTPVSCDFSHLNADCAPYGAVCDYLYGQCSCCFVHDQFTCASDADCEASFGADAFCSAGTCGCK